MPIDQNKLNALIELDKRGVLSTEKKAALNELIKRNSVQKEPGFFDKGGALDTKILTGQSLPLVGLVGGGLAGTTIGGPYGSIVGAGTGHAVGSQLERALRQSLGFDSPDLLRDIRNIGSEFVTGAASEMAGQSIAPGLKFLKGSLSKIPGVSAAKNFVSESASDLSKKLATSAFPETQSALANTIKQGKETVGEKAISRGLYGFTKNVLEKAKASKESFGQEIDSLLKSVDDQRIDPTKVAKSIEEVSARFKATGNKQAVKQLENRAAYWLDNIINNKDKIFISSGNTVQAVKDGLLTPTEANLLKRYFGQEASAVFKQKSVDAVSSVNAEFANAMRSGLKKEIEKIVPQIKIVNKEYHVYDEVVDSISKGLAKDLSSNGITLRNPISTLGAGGAGFFIGGGPGVAIGAGAIQASRSFPVKTFLASQLQKLAANPASEKVAQDVYANMMSHPVFRMLILNQLKSNFNKFGNENRRNK